MLRKLCTPAGRIAVNGTPCRRSAIHTQPSNVFNHKLRSGVQHYSRSRSRFSSTASSKPNGDGDPSLLKHAAKTLITYSIPLGVFGAFGYYTSKKEKEKELQAAGTGKESFGSIMMRVFKGEKVWETMGPRKEYIKVTRLNDRFSNYNYCLEKNSISGGTGGALGESSGGGAALAELRMKHKEALQKLRSKGFVSSVRPTDLTDVKLQALLAAEKEYDAAMSANLKAQDTSMRQLRALLMKITKGSPSAADAPQTPVAAGKEITLMTGKNTNAGSTDPVFEVTPDTKATFERLSSSLSNQVSQQLQIEQKYIGKVAQLLSAEEKAFLAEFLASSDSAGSTDQFQLYKQAPLAAALLLGVEVEKQGATTAITPKPPVVAPRVFVLEFKGDTMATQVKALREEVTAVLQQADVGRGDSVVVKLTSGGGTVTGYGLAASQLMRLKNETKVTLRNGKEKHLPVTVCVDEVAASGGYMMACVADSILVSPFAAIGSIGVIATIPNFHERLKREGVNFIDVTAGQYKRTLTPYKEPNEADEQKMKEDVAVILDNFKSFIVQQRPALKSTIETVATGEVWHGADAVTRGLADGVRCCDDVLLEHISKRGAEVLAIKYVGDRIEAREEKEEEGFFVSGSNGGSTGALVDRAVGWFSERVLQHVLGALGGGGASSGVGNYPPSIMGTGGSADAARGELPPIMALDSRYGGAGVAGAAAPGTPMARFTGGQARP